MLIQRIENPNMRYIMTIPSLLARFVKAFLAFLAWRGFKIFLRSKTEIQVLYSIRSLASRSKSFTSELVKFLV